jgi:hypothetical protein
MTSNRLELTGLVLVALLFFVWPIPHTVTLRDLLLAGTLVFGGYVVWSEPARRHWPPALSVPALLAGTLLLWLCFQALLISPETLWALDEVRSQWVRSLAALAAGGLVALAFGYRAARGRRLVTLLASVLLLHVLVVDAILLFGGVEDIEPETRLAGWSGGADKINYLANLLLALLLAEAFVRATARHRVLPIGNVALIGTVAAALFSQYGASMRNAIIELSAVGLVAVVLFVQENRRRLRQRVVIAGAAVALAIPVLVGYISYRADDRWRQLVDTVPVALQTELHRHWLDMAKYPPPRTAGGAPVEISAYLRVAWLKEGALLVIERPLGVGFGRNAFGHALAAKYGEGRGHSHSGLLDLAIGAGIPGALLWIAFLASLWRLGYRAFRATHDYHALLLVLAVTGYGVRMLVDSTIRDHMLQQFMFVTGLFAMLAARRLAAAPAARA